MQLNRLFSMLYLLLDHEQLSATALARRLGVSVRTVYRDVQTLCEAGVPLYAERGRGGGIRILPTYKLNKSVLSESERHDILWALEAAKQSGASQADTLSKLRAFLGDDSPEWIRIDFSDWSGRGDALLSLLRTSILSRRLLTFDYYGESGACSARVVCPIRLWFKGNAWYLVAYCMTRQAMRTFKLTRIKRAQVSPGSFPPDALSCLRDEGKSRAATPLMCPMILMLDAQMAYRVYDDFAEEEITCLEDGRFRVETAFPQGEWIASLILSYAEHAQVLAPQSLRHDIQAKLQKMLANYKT